MGYDPFSGEQSIKGSLLPLCSPISVCSYSPPKCSKQTRTFFLLCALAVLFELVPGNAHSAEECGAYAGPNGSILCDTTTKASSSTDNIEYTALDGLTLTVNDGALLLNTTTFSVYAASAPTSANVISIIGTNVGELETTGDSSHGLYAIHSGTGAASTSLADGTISTTGGGAHGQTAWITSATSVATASVTISGGTTSTSGSSAHGAHARTNSTGTGSAIATMTNGAVVTSGTNAFGIRAYSSGVGGSGAATATILGGSISTTNNGSDGLNAVGNGSGTVQSNVSGGSIITQGTTAHGASSLVLNSTATGTAISSITNGTVETSGDTANGLRSDNNGVGDASILISGGTITTSGSTSHGGYAVVGNTSSSADASVHQTGGGISTGGYGAVGLSSENTGLGNSTTLMDGGTVTTQGTLAQGLYSVISNSISNGSALSTLTSGTISTSGEESYGLFSQNDGLGASLVQIDGGSITTDGETAYGAFGHIANTSSTSTTAVNIADGSIETNGAGAYGIYSEHEGLGDATVTIDGGTVSTTGTNGRGATAFVNNASSTGVSSVAMSAGTINTSGLNGYGLRSSNIGAGTAQSTMSGGTITTQNNSAYGVYSQNSGSGNALVNLEGGTIQTNGFRGHGLRAEASGLGTAEITVGEGTILTVGNQARGVQAVVTNNASSSAATIAATNVWIETQGENAHGMVASNAGTGNTSVTISAGDVSTTGELALGLYSNISNATSNESAAATISGGSINTSGVNSRAVQVQNAGLGATRIIQTDGALSTTGANSDGLRGATDNVLSSATLSADITGGSITASGDSSNGIFLRHLGSGAYSASVSSSTTITSGSGQAAGIRTVGSGGGTITIGSGATIDSSESRIAIRDGDSDLDGNDELANAGNVTVDTSGTVTGDAILGFGNDSFTLRGGIYTGDIYGDDVTASANDGNDSFSWLGGALNSGFYGGNGSDTASIDANAIYDGTEVMDGGDDVSSTDGWIDNLTITGQIATVAPDTWLNWENITLDSSTLTYQGNDLTVGSEPGYGLTLTNGARLRVTSGFALTGNLVLANGTVLETTGTDAGTFAIIGDVQNNGTLSLADGGAGDQLTITGSVAGPGIVIVDVDTSNGTADTVRVNGDASGATATVQVNNLTPSTSSGVDIPVIMIESGSPFASYSLAGGSFVAGAYTYELREVGSNAVLVASFNSNGQTYQIAPLVLASAFTSLPTLQKRTAGRKTHGNQQALWTRISTDQLNAQSASGLSFESAVSWYQGGVDYRWDGFTPGHWVFGVNVGYGTLTSRLSDTNRFGSLSASGLATGATATWFGERGTYVDLQSQAVWMQTSAASTDSGRLKEDLPATAFASSLEIGQEVSFANRWKAIPQAQLKWGQVSASQFFDATGSRVDIGHNDSLIGRAGLAIRYDRQGTGDELGISAHLISNILHEFKPESEVSIGGQPLNDEIDQTWAEVGFGADIKWGNRFALFGELAYRQSLSGSASDNHGLSASGGVRYNW